MTVRTGFDECFDEHYPRLVAFAVATTGDGEAGRELAQEAFARLHANWSRISTYDQPGAWLRRVVANLAIDRHRSQRSERRALERVAVAASAEPDHRPDTWTELVAMLPPRQRAIVTLHYGEDLPVAQIAELLDISVNTVKSALSKARDTLRTRLERSDA